MANKIVAGELYRELDGQLFELKRQLRQLNGYPFNAFQLRAHLQAAIEGRFESASEIEIVDPSRPFSYMEGLEFLRAAGLECPSREQMERFAMKFVSTPVTHGKPFVVFLHDSSLPPYGCTRFGYVNRYCDARGLPVEQPYGNDCVIAGVRPRRDQRPMAPLHPGH